MRDTISRTLIAVSATSNRSKSYRDPAERHALQNGLARCPDQLVTVTLAR
ncbi:hypothetical protein ACIO13_26010 [Streptomyces sp. NPDC087425]